MNDRIPIILTGAAGRMGREAVKAISAHETTYLLGALTRETGLGQDVGHMAGIGDLGLALAADLAPLLERAPAETVMVELTKGLAAFEHACQALSRNLAVVIGATGLSETQIETLRQKAEERACGVLLVPNFSLGALLMMRFAAAAAPYFKWAEIIEKHHEKKQDAPSGTARKTAQMMAASQSEREAASMDFAARGELVEGIPVHSVRLPGLLAHQEVIFGEPGETLTIQHDSLDRSCFMPGLLMAIEKVRSLKQFVYGLDHLI